MRTVSKSEFLSLLQIVLPLLLLFGHGFLYNGIGEIAAGRGIDFGPLLRIPLDDRIPFVAVFVLAYHFVWFFPLLLTVCVVRERGLDEAPFRRLSLSLVILLLSCYALWILFPVSVDLRLDQSVLAGYGRLGELVAFTYERASLWNACPSFHVAGPWLLCRSLPLANRFWRWFFWTAVVAILASTVLIRIHYLLDIVFGILIAELVYHGVRSLRGSS